MKSAPAYSWLRCFAFRQRTQRYDHFEFAGNPVVVVNVTGSVVQLVTHDPRQVKSVEVTLEKFFTQYFVDPCSTPEASARVLRGHYASTCLSAVQPVPQLVESIITKAPSLEDFKMTKKTSAAKSSARVCADFHRRTCIELSRTSDQVSYIPLCAENGICVEKLDAKEFDKRYESLADYPVEKAARLYAEYSQHLGATKEAMQQLAKLCPILDKEIEMATAKKAATTAAKTEKAVIAKANSKIKPAAKPAAKVVVAVKTAASTKPIAKPITKPITKPAAKPQQGEKRESAAQMFQDLIMAGKLSDDKIFEKVQEKYGLDEKKRSYVKWYRNHLTKQGANPPAAK